MRNYELLLLIRSTLDEAATTDAAKAVAELIEKQQGTISSTNVWGRRKLAYPIDKQLEATYILLKFATTPTNLPDLEFNLRLNEAILRYLLVRDETPRAISLQETPAADEATDDTADAESAEPEAEADTSDSSVEEPAFDISDQAETASAPAEAETETDSEAEAPAVETQAVPEVAGEEAN